MVPEGWSEKQLQDIGIVERGKFSARPRNDPQYYGGDIPFVQTGDIASSGTYLTTYSQTLNNKGLGVSRIFPKGTILITIAANIGESAIATFDVACPDSVVAIQTNPEITNAFWLTMALYVQKRRLDNQAAQNARKNINLQVLRPLRVLTPPIEEQNKIAEILSTWGRAIEKTEQLIDNSEAQKKALMQKLLTGKNRLPGFYGDWNSVKLKSICSRVQDRNAELNDNVLTISGQQGLIKQEAFFNKRVASDALEGYFLLSRGQFAYNKSYSNGYPMGAIKRLKRYEKGVVTTLYICFEVSDLEACDPNFLEHYFDQGLLNRGLTKIANEGGRAHGLLNVKPADFFSLEVNLPDIKEQREIENVLTSANKEVIALKEQLHLLKKEKRALMQQLLTGKRRVNLAKEEVA